LENLGAGNIDMTPEDISEINDVLENHEVQGDRYFGVGDKAAHLWG
jgi:pyridoxine 4-dehydrogenase